MREQFELD